MQNTGKNNFVPSACRLKKRKTNCWSDWQEDVENVNRFADNEMCRSGTKEQGNWVLRKKRREAKKIHRKIWSTLTEINFNLKFNKEKVFWEKVAFASPE